jgi:hypothetical protein
MNAIIVKNSAGSHQPEKAQVQVVKVKSHRGVYLKLEKVAERGASEAAAAGQAEHTAIMIPLLFNSLPEQTSFSFSWWADPEDEHATTTTDWCAVSRQWAHVTSQQALNQAWGNPTLASAFLLNDSFHLHLQ